MTKEASPRRRIPAWFYAALAALVIMPFPAAELVLRRLGHTPAGGGFTNEPILLRPDPELGWRNEPGRHVFPGYSPEARTITLTIDSEGRRVTGPAPRIGWRTALVGDSFTEGWAISDQDTFAWKLQERQPRLVIENYGVAGYGTYQSYLRMRQLLREKRPPEIYLYGFVGDHGRRNVADPTWLRALTARSRGRVNAPYCTLAESGRLVHHPPEHIVRFPLRAQLASAFFLEQWSIGVGAARRTAQAEEVLRALVREMQKAARARIVRFAVVILTVHPGQARRFAKFLESEEIPFIDCNRQLGPGRVVVGEGHPNEVVHQEWAECIAAGIGPLIPQTPPRGTKP